VVGVRVAGHGARGPSQTRRPRGDRRDHLADAGVEGQDAVAGFEVVHLPGHAPGLIALWRAGDGLALTSDCFYTVDPQTFVKGAARLPHAAFTAQVEQARASLRKLAALEPAAAWAGHTRPVTGDVRAQLDRAAADAG